MENASKALIIAGAILISILLISVGILIFNSTSGTTNNAGVAGDSMEMAAAREKAKIVLGTMNIEDDTVFNNYIKNKYGGDRLITSQEVIELYTLVVERSKQIAGVEYIITETHITSSAEVAVRWTGTDFEFNINESNKYKVFFNEDEEYDGNYSIYIQIKK